MPRKFYTKKDPERVNWKEAYERQCEINWEQARAFFAAQEALQQKLAEMEQKND